MDKLQLRVFKMLSFFTGALLCGLLWGSVSLAQVHALSCGSIFHKNADLLIAMNPQYRGEDRGQYVDPVTKSPWKVKYFNQAELVPFQLTLKEGRFYDHKGRKAESEYDAEAMQFETSLIVIDRDFNFFALPFERRGEFHHSSLSNGKDIIFAGTASFSDGIIREFSNSSGHYKPSTAQTLKVLKILSNLGVNLSMTKLTGNAALEIKKVHSISAKDLKELIP